VFEERLVVAVPSGHVLEKLDRVSLEAIADLPLIFFTRQLIPGFHAQIVELFQRVGAFPKVAQHAIHLQTIVGLVASGVGISILPSFAERVSREGVVYRALDVPDATSWMGPAWVEGDEWKLVKTSSAPYARWQGAKYLTSPTPIPTSAVTTQHTPRVTFEAFHSAGNVRILTSRFSQRRLQSRVALFLSGFAVVSALRQMDCSTGRRARSRETSWHSFCHLRFTCKLALFKSRRADSNRWPAHYE
jgi:hypothetical protein